jgi:hypothetical protein
MWSVATEDFLQAGSALIVATVSSTGEPIATRGWGLDVIDAEEGRVRLLVSSADAPALANLEDSGRISITATDVPTLHSMQLKGRLLGGVAATDTDRARADRYCDAFYRDVERSDGTPRRLLQRIRPEDFVVFEVVVDEFYDQTPGPGAGASLATP